MKEMEFLRKLDEAAAEPPSIDVSARVIRDIRAQMRPAANDARPLWLAAILSTAIAAAVVMFAVQEISSIGDPFNGLLTPLKTAIQYE